MAEYISKDRVKDYIHAINSTHGFTSYEDYTWLMDAVINAPAADVQPVKRGRWIETHISLCKWIPENEKEEGHNFYMAELKCSCCERYNTVTFALSLTKPDFCQLCGARMDLGDEKT